MRIPSYAHDPSQAIETFSNVPGPMLQNATGHGSLMEKPPCGIGCCTPEWHETLGKINHRRGQSHCQEGRPDS